ncbi:hypothetical protein NBT05_14555 [Aquimarina sp. ERC-38]|uniref:hypothetical protein n=1 Tax=Aquimarina sp. ERC-38 TaxID=2949996 RepID=UPI002247695D|nr:hypothetical protein [Aquimarina sp. ERC-38]UZO80164.1 hypothetical protein NBT05_14555 [Aquimarina sp. ERC-38]
MVTFLMILLGLVSLNFILLKYSTQSVDKKKTKTKKQQVVNPYTKEKEGEIAKAA